MNKLPLGFSNGKTGRVVIFSFIGHWGMASSKLGAIRMWLKALNKGVPGSAYCGPKYWREVV